MGRSPQCYIPSFVEIGPSVLEKRNVEGCLPYMGVAAMSSDFHFLVPESFHKKLVQIGTVVSEKIQFESLYVHDLRPRSRNVPESFLTMCGSDRHSSF